MSVNLLSYKQLLGHQLVSYQFTLIVIDSLSKTPKPTNLVDQDELVISYKV